MSDCIFCQIISKEMEAYMIYENELVCCFLDREPINNGHVLVVPKNTIKSLMKWIEKV